MILAEASDLLLPRRRLQPLRRLSLAFGHLLRLVFPQSSLGAPAHARLGTLFTNGRLVHRLERIIEAGVVQIRLAAASIWLSTSVSSSLHLLFQISL